MVSEDTYAYVFEVGIHILDALKGLSIILNAVALVAIVRGIVEKKPVHKFLISLCLSDMLVSFTTFLAMKFVHMIPLCLSNLLTVFSVGAVQGSSVVLALDQYIAVCHPFRHVVWLTPRRTHVILTAIWVISLIHSCIYYIGAKFQDNDDCLTNYEYSKNWLIIWICISVVVLITLIVLNLRVVLAIRKIGTMQLGGTVNSTPSRKGFVTAAIIVGTYILFNTPVDCAYLLMYLGVLPEFQTGLIYLISLYWSMLNPLIDPFIFSVRMPEVREAYRKVYRCCRCCAGKS